MKYFQFDDIIVHFLFIMKMLQPFHYLYQTIKQEFLDELVICRDITEFYADRMYRAITFKKKIKQIDGRLAKARTYEDWRQIAQEHDNLQQIVQKLNNVYSSYYDYTYIQELKNQLYRARQNNQPLKIISILRSHSYRNIGNMNSHLLYRDAYNYTNKLIQEFQEEMVKCLRSVLDSALPIHKKLQFFGELRHSVGRSALLLSGGAIMGMYHIGVVQTLLEADCMPKIIAGSSAGSMIAAFVATRDREVFFDGERFNFGAFANEKKMSLWKKFKRVAKEGYVLDINTLKSFLRDNLGDITFQQAFDKFGYILNITVTGTSEHDEDRLLNYLTAPNVLIWSACAASCAIPFIYGATDLFCKDNDGETRPYTLMNRKFLDGSIGHDLPMNKLSIFFNVNNFIVSQTNPWVIPFLDYTQEFRTTSNPIIIRLLILFHRLKEFLFSELKHRVNQLTFIFPSAITKFFNLATQSYVGNITIWPVPSVSDYIRILDSPTDFEMIVNFVEDGRMRTYPKIRQIKSTLFYEKELGECFKKLKASLMDMMGSRENLQHSVGSISKDDFQEEQYTNAYLEIPKQNLNRYQHSIRNKSFNFPREAF